MTPDICTNRVIAQLQKRVDRGLAKYGCTVQQSNLEVTQWLQHLQEELLDAAVYIEKLKGEFMIERKWVSKEEAKKMYSDNPGQLEFNLKTKEASDE